MIPDEDVVPWGDTGNGLQHSQRSRSGGWRDAARILLKVDPEIPTSVDAARERNPYVAQGLRVGAQEDEQRGTEKTKRSREIMAPDTVGSTLDRTDLAARAVDLVKVYGEGPTAVRALDGVSVDFPAGRFTAIMGPSGSGKSTLMHCLAGLDKVTSGQVYIGGTDLSTLSEKQLTLLRRERIGFIFQSFNLLPTLNAAENVELPIALAGRKPDRGWVDRVIDAVGLRDRLSHRPSELSGGQQQRVAAARALASKPSIVFADEPTGNLDSNASAELLGFLRRSVDEFGQTIVMVTHDPSAASHSDHVLFLQDGRVVDEMANPTADKVLDLMKKLGG
jgi:putative ABC transport system ATP-binding protein